MKNIICIYGGKSVEHDISILTGLQTLENIDMEKYSVLPVYVTRNGEFVSPKNPQKREEYVLEPKRYKKVDFIPGRKEIKLGRKKLKIDCVINCMHGVNGEDGALSAICQLSGIPITCPSMISSAICMDKIIMKDIFRANGLPCVDYRYFSKTKYESDSDGVILTLESLEYPLVVKPANLGSSIGIAIAKNREELIDAIDTALGYDSRILVEKCITDLREINCSCLGDGEDCETSMLEEPNGWKEFLDFKEKYIKASKTQSTEKRFNVDISKETKEQIFELSKKAFEIFCCSGVIRIDFMLDKKTDKIYINELNTIPGSLAFYLWKDKFSFGKLIDKIIDIAIKRQKNLDLNNYSYKSDVLLINRGERTNKYAK